MQDIFGRPISVGDAIIYGRDRESLGRGVVSKVAERTLTVKSVSRVHRWRPAGPENPLRVNRGVMLGDGRRVCVIDPMTLPQDETALLLIRTQMDIRNGANT